MRRLFIFFLLLTVPLAAERPCWELKYEALCARATYYEREAERLELRRPEMVRYFRRLARIYRCRAHRLYCRCHQCRCELESSPSMDATKGIS